ncbi:MAG TPA: DEAD/DEAH box helicase [Actinomycetota bacterium]|nr:DEAD/DEAH box helicase [Actinomycetota bacterium]
MTGPDPLDGFSPVARAWFEGAFEAPTAAQTGAWAHVRSGRNALVVAPTGSGKTLAAFLWALDRVATAPAPDERRGVRVLYVSPLKALAVDVERNLRTPLAGMRAAAQRLGLAPPSVSVAVRTGDTPADERRRFATAPADVLITTPESLFLLLTSRARGALESVETVIVDEVHALAGTKRGAHLALSLERLDALAARPVQRVGLSATVRPPDEVARWLGGPSDVHVVHAPGDKRFELSVVVPVEDLSELGRPTGEPHEGSAAGAEARTSVWPHVEERVLDLVRSHSSTIVFVNSRRLAERLCARLNDLAGEEVARAHHGSVARDQRLRIEEDLKAGRLPAVVATSSLELGIDMAAVDLVVQVEAPDSVSSGLQRVGRAGHHVGAVSRGIFFPKYRGDLLECAVVVERMRRGEIEELRYPRNPLDVLAQHVVSMVALDDWTVDDVDAVVRRAAPFRDLPRSALEGVLDMLAGRYPSDDFAELRARVTWDRTAGRISARRGAQRLAVTSGGTIPDRGLFGVFLAGEQTTRVGELDEEMVYESRVGEVFVLGSSSWLIEDITHDRVLVSPAPGQPGKMPFWHGDAPGRPVELGRALGAFVRELASMPPQRRLERLRGAGLDDFAAGNLAAYLDEQRAATGVLPDDRTIVVERFRDELGDWRLCVHSPFGARVHAPWSHVVEAHVRDRLGLDVQCMYTDDGIVARLPESDDAPPGSSVVFDPDDVEDAVVAELGGSALFASRFRECAARALLLPRRRPGSRTPLWQQRQRSAHLLQVARRYPSFPIVLETYRECLQDVFDVPGLVELMAAIRRREIRVVEVDTSAPSPFATSLQLDYVGAFMYEGDAPLAERRAQALSLDRTLLSELLGRAELRELIDDGALADLELELQRVVDGRRARDAGELHDLLRALGDLDDAEVAARSERPADAASWLEELQRTRRALEVRIAGTRRWIAIEDAARVRDALGVALPVGVPGAFLEPVDDPLGDVVARYARTHGPFVADDVARRLGLGVAVVTGVLRALEERGRVVEGEFRPGGTRPEWIDVDVLRRLRRRSLAALRREVEPVDHDVLARFALAWHDVGGRGGPGDHDALYRAVERLQGAPLPASQLETQIMPARVPGYRPGLLDELCASGEVVWAGAGALGSDDGWVQLALAEHAPALVPEASDVPLSDGAAAVRGALAARGASFFRQLADATGSTDDRELLLALWELVWAGIATNDTLAPLRALVGGAATPARSRARRRGPSFPSRLGPPSGAGRWSLLPRDGVEPTRRAHALATVLLERHGVVTRGAVAAERTPGGFAAVYPVLKALEESGRCRRGYFVDGLGGAQFALPGAVDRLRALAHERAGRAVVLAAADPANPYGAALPWPERDVGPGHRPGRKAGASVVVLDGVVALYVEKGGRSALCYCDDDDLPEVAAALAAAARAGTIGPLHVQRADGVEVFGSRLGDALEGAGFRPTSRGLRLAPGTPEARPRAGASA